MAALGSQSIASSYEQLLHVDADGGGNGTTLVNVKDGDNGTTFALQLASDKIQANGTLTVGADDTGYDVIFYGDTASSNMTWDTSGDDLILNDARLFINQDDNVTALEIDTEATTGIGIFIDTPATTTVPVLKIADCNALTTGNIAYFHSESTSGASRSLVEIHNDSTSATDTVCLKITQDASATNAPAIELTGGGIKFPATQVASGGANTLDDYEEGTYEPTMNCSTSGSFTAGTVDTLAYTKVGRVVHVQGKLSITADNSANGTVNFSLPFTASSGLAQSADSSAGAVMIRSGGTEIPNNQIAVVGDGATSFYIMFLADDAVSDNVGSTNVDAAWDIWLGLSYIAA